jgi:type 1 glutamine amidotransferase
LYHKNSTSSQPKGCLYLRMLTIARPARLLIPAIVAISLLFTVNSFAAPRLPRVLIFGKTGGYHHNSIPVGMAAITALGQQHGFAVDTTTDSLLFTKHHLRKYKAVVFLSTSGNILDSNGRKALAWFIHRGGGYVGIHGASTTLYAWPWYHLLVGATFNKHPEQQRAEVTVTDTVFAATRGMPAQWQWWDEWYNFKDTHFNQVHILLTVNEATYKGGTMGTFHPISWYQSFEGGRSFYTAMGHTDEAYSNPLFLAHLLGGIEWAMGKK